MKYTCKIISNVKYGIAQGINDRGQVAAYSAPDSSVCTLFFGHEKENRRFPAVAKTAEITEPAIAAFMGSALMDSDN